MSSKENDVYELNHQIVNILFLEHKIVKMTINRQIWQLCIQPPFFIFIVIYFFQFLKKINRNVQILMAPIKSWFQKVKGKHDNGNSSPNICYEKIFPDCKQSSKIFCVLFSFFLVFKIKIISIVNTFFSDYFIKTITRDRISNDKDMCRRLKRLCMATDKYINKILPA